MDTVSKLWIARYIGQDVAMAEAHGFKPGKLANVLDKRGPQLLVRTPNGKLYWFHESHFENAEETPKENNLEPEKTLGLRQDGLKPKTNDPVIRPNHYARFVIEPIYFIMKNNLPFWAGNVIKYVCRHDAKNGLEDLKKARRYLDMQIKKMEGDPDFAG